MSGPCKASAYSNSVLWDHREKLWRSFKNYHLVGGDTHHVYRITDDTESTCVVGVTFWDLKMNTLKMMHIVTVGSTANWWLLLVSRFLATKCTLRALQYPNDANVRLSKRTISRSPNEGNKRTLPIRYHNTSNPVALKKARRKAVLRNATRWLESGAEMEFWEARDFIRSGNLDYPLRPLPRERHA